MTRQAKTPDEIFAEAEDTFGRWGEVRRPEAAEPPILGADTRQVLHQWLHELNYADELSKVGVQPRRRTLLKGPPGTGKTTLAWHVAARLGVPLVVVETPSLLSQYIAETGQNLGRLFSAARRFKGGVALFFDEIDAVAHSRQNSSSSAGTEQNNIVVALLQMFDRHTGLIFAATNRPEAIDAAIWRRFQLQIEVGLPGPAERFAIVKRYVSPFALPDASLNEISAALAGASPALIREVIETMKRDLVLGPRIGHALDAAALFARIRAGTSPSPDMQTPPLWDEDRSDDVLAKLAKVAWPPVREAA